MDEETKVTEQDSLDAAKAQAFLKAEQEQRAKNFADYIEAGKAKFNCDLVGVPIYTQANDGWKLIIDVRIITGPLKA